METTYAIVGTDGKQYGPITLSQVMTWIGEGRIGTETQVWRSDTNSWQPAAQYVELGLGAHPFPARPPAPGMIRAPAADGADPRLELRVQRSARWFFWIAGLSIINAITVSTGTGVAFAFGLAIQFYVGFTGTGMALVCLVSGLFALFGYFATKRHTWSFIAGMLLYAGDGLLAVLRQDWLLAAIHAFVLYWVFLGLKASLQLNAQSKAGPA